jgi:hypothetical protein
VWSQRSVVDYALARRATVAALLTGARVTTDVCDAHPYLLRAAKFHGEPTEQPTRELEPMAREHGEFRVYVVEVCQSCAWNHLATSYVLGDGVPRGRARRRRLAEE